MDVRALSNSPKYAIGELVKWYELYADGFLTKDAGYGLVLKVHETTFLAEPHFTVLIYRTKHADTMTFAINEIEKIKR